MRDRGFERRERMVGALIMVASGVITTTLIGGAVVIILHFVIKYW